MTDVPGRTPAMARNSSPVNACFDQVWVLNLAARGDRRNAMHSKLTQLGIEAEFITAVNGYDFHNRLEYENYLALPPVADTTRYGLQRKPITSVGAWGCLKSYLQIIEEAKRRGYARILCLEDDAVFHKDFTRLFLQAQRDIPADWKLLYLGASQRSWNIPADLAVPDTDTRVFNPAAPFYYPRRTFGTYALGIHCSVYDLMLRAIRSMETPIDNGPVESVFKAYPRQCYVLTPNLIIADVADSDIRGGRSQQELASRLHWNLDDYDFSETRADAGSGPTTPRGKTARMEANYRNHSNILIEPHRAILCLIPKTGCTSLKAQLAEPLGMVAVGDLDETVHEADRYPFPFADAALLNTEYRDYFRFAIVRNPWDRLWSCFRDKIRAPDYNASGYTNGVAAPLQRFDDSFFGGMSFPEFVDAVCKIPDAVADRHFRSQVYSLSDSNGELLVNYIGRFENLQQSLDEINASTGLTLSSAVHLNQSDDNSPFRDHYNEELAEKVRRRYFADIQLLLYSFEPTPVEPIGVIDSKWSAHFSPPRLLACFLEEQCRALRGQLRETDRDNMALRRKLDKMQRRLQRKKEKLRVIQESRTANKATPWRLVLAALRRRK